MYCIQVKHLYFVSNVYEPPPHLRGGGGGVYLGRTKYIVKKKTLLKNNIWKNNLVFGGRHSNGDYSGER
jgi:hypothetical protein